MRGVYLSCGVNYLLSLIERTRDSCMMVAELAFARQHGWAIAVSGWGG